MLRHWYIAICMFVQGEILELFDVTLTLNGLLQTKKIKKKFLTSLVQIRKQILPAFFTVSKIAALRRPSSARCKLSSRAKTKIHRSGYVQELIPLRQLQARTAVSLWRVTRACDIDTKAAHLNKKHRNDIQRGPRNETLVDSRNLIAQ